MKLLNLNGSWVMTDLGSGRRLAASVPGTVAATLLERQVIPDPYWRENESIVQPVFEVDYEFSREFDLEAEARSPTTRCSSAATGSTPSPN